MPLAARWAMIRDTASRQLWSSLSTWERKPQMVVTGLNTRSRYLTPCSLRTSRMLASVKTSANGRPSLREAARHLIQARHEIGFGVSGRDVDVGPVAVSPAAATRRHSLLFAEVAAEGSRRRPGPKRWACEQRNA